MEKKDSELILDFNPIIDYFNLTGVFSLIHWQAKPVNYRQWGIYQGNTDNYKSVKAFQFKGKLTSLQIPDSEIQTLPSAVLLLQ